jgi:hypothetical protein
MRWKEIQEAVIDVALQGKMPVSPGSMGLMMSRVDYGRSIEQNQPNVVRGAIDSLAAALEEPVDVDQLISDTCLRFRMTENELKTAFERAKGQRVWEYHRQALERRKNSPMKI